MDATNTMRATGELPGPAVPDADNQPRGHDNSDRIAQGAVGASSAPADGHRGEDGMIPAEPTRRIADPTAGLGGEPEPPECLYVIRVEGPVNPDDPELAAALQAVREAADRDPNRFRNNPERKREALEGFRRLIEEYEAEHGAFTEEEMARAQSLLYGP